MANRKIKKGEMGVIEMAEEVKYDYYYFENRKPFRNALKKVADLNVEAMVGRTYSFLGRTEPYVDYYISYDMKKLLENLPELKRIISRTKIYKVLDDVRADIDAIPDKWQDFENYQKLKETLDMLIELSMKFPTCDCKYHYKIENDIREELSFKRHFWSKLEKPLLSIRESNGWEHAVFQVWFDLPKDEKSIEGLVALKQRLEELGEIDQKIGKTSYRVILDAVSYESIEKRLEKDLDMGMFAYSEESLNLNEVQRFVEMNDEDLFQAMYKSNFMSLFR